MDLDSRAIGLGFAATAALFVLGGFALEYADAAATLVGAVAGLVGGLVAGFLAKDGATAGAADGGVAAVAGTVFALPILAFLGVLVGEVFGPADSFLFASLEGVAGPGALITLVLTVFVATAVPGTLGGAVGGAVGGRSDVGRGGAAA
jgi:hypothetical protein